MPASNNVLRFPKPLQPAAPPDHAARETALDTTRSLIVEAPAGSGKTALLVQRYLKLLADPATTQPEEVLAITFTRKATTELRERILQPLQFAHGNPDPDATHSPFQAVTHSLALAVLARDAEGGWGLLDRPQRLAVRTIDSLCAEIASTLPLLSGGAVGRTPIENAQPLYLLAAERTLLQFGGPDEGLHNALRTVLLHRDGNLAECARLLARMLQQRDQWGELIPLGEELNDQALEEIVRPRLEEALRHVVCAGLSRAGRAMPPDALAALSWLAARLAHEPGYDSRLSPINVCADRSEPPEEQAEHLEHWRALIHLLLTKDGWRKARGITDRNLGFLFPKAEKNQLVELIESIQSDELYDVLCAVRNLPPATYPDRQWEVAGALFRLLYRALAELKVLFSERGECDFAELALGAKQALRSDTGPADLADASGATLRHLLVDEMQDTSSSQYELIELLTHTWDGMSQTLFLVGDPKQSIYLFRQARVERFLHAMEQRRLGDIPLTALRLTANFRSQSELVENFNEDFSQIFPPPQNYAPRNTELNLPLVPFVPAEAVRPPSPVGAHRVWHTCVYKESTHDPETPTPDAARHHRTHEARAIRRIVADWLARPLPVGRTKPWKIAVLGRTRDHLSDVVAEFRRADEHGANIPFNAVEIERLGEQPEVLDALALTRALLHPADRVAWLAVLHAPWCGLGLADLLALSGGVSAEPLPAVLAARSLMLSTEGAKFFDRVWRILDAALSARGQQSTAMWVERTWRSLGGDVSLDARALANTSLFFQTLREFEQPGGAVDVAAFSDAVGALFVEPGSADASVTLSTIHKAKGLEWDVVLVPSLERVTRNSSSELLNWLELDSSSGDDHAHVILAPIQVRGEASDDLYDWLNSVRSDREAAERKRLFYVACTRAQEELHLFAAATRSAKGELYAPAASLLKAAWPAAEPHFDPAPASNILSTTVDQFRRAVDLEDDKTESETLALAAVGEAVVQQPRFPILHRLPLSFEPHQRFAEAAANRLPYTPAESLPRAPLFDRPEGSFAVRAFGNVVHRYLQQLATTLANGISVEMLLAELSSWLPRLTASLRAEGLSPAGIPRLAERSLHALQNVLADPTGRWILAPHTASESEQALRHSGVELRVDRTFLSGATPLSSAGTHRWIVDFKTTELGGRSPEAFAEGEKRKYAAQLGNYARTHRALTGLPATPNKPIILALYYPLIPTLLHWPAENLEHVEV